ncbi:MAG: type II toxin-antitoxin system RelE/ParE family toxin [Saprospiraceae bacterium]
MTYRLFTFWDKNQNRVVVATHGIIKKSNKTPKKEIEKAEIIRNEYFKSTKL